MSDSTSFLISILISILAIITVILYLLTSSLDLMRYSFSGKARRARFEPEPEPEPVFLGASAPQEVRPGDQFTARFVAYIEELEREIKIKLSKLSSRSQSHLGLKYCRWKRNTKVKVKLYGEHFIVSSQEEEFVWQGSSNLIDFDVMVPQDVQEGTTVLKFDVSIDEITVAKLRLDLKINSAATARERTIIKTEPAHTAFASYASQDRLRVLDRVSEIQRNGVDVFLDCLSLHPGEE